MKASRLQTILRFAVVAIGIGIVAAVTAVGRRQKSMVTQPVRFNHKIHLQEAGLDCVNCHEQVREHDKAGRPQMETCAQCHEGEKTDNQEIQKVIAAIEQNREIEWKRISEVPKHVYFSHRRHIIFGEIQCETCHGLMKERTSPPLHPLREFSMERCIRCHAERNVTTDCLACHK